MTIAPTQAINCAANLAEDAAPPNPVSPAAAALPPAPQQSGWMPRMWQRKWLILIVAIGLGGLAYAILRYVEGTSVAVDVVERADLIETVVASGHVESPFRVDISSQITGTVVSVAVREGETVRAGQQLILLSANELQSSALQAQAAVAQAAAQVRQLSELSLPQAMAAQNSAGSSLLAAQQVYDRAAVLAAKGFATRAYFDEVTRNRDVARTQVATAAAQVRSAQAGGSDFATAQANLAAAMAGSSAARSRLAYTIISAPRSGILISRAVERGTVVTPGALLMVLSPAAETQIVMQIDERNLGKIAVGQSALVSADAYPNRRFTAAIAFINPGVDITRASATVKLTVPNPPTYLRQDMTVSVDVETARKRAVLSLPGSSIHDALSAAPWVMTIENGRAVRRPVRLGLQGNNRTQVLSGIDAGAHVIPVGSSIAVGARVSPIVK